MTERSLPAIEIDALRKVYGSTVALDGISLAVPQGSVFGFLGPNGAGKSTTLGILTGLDFPTSGTARILGHDVVTETPAVQPLIGYLPDVPNFYGWMTPNEFLRLIGRLFGIPDDTLSGRIDTVLDLTGLTAVTRPIGGFSRGMRQRLGLAQALINAPKVLLLDEPTSALDPIGRRDVLDIIAALAGRTTVFFSTHILADVERVCDRVAIIDQGRVVIESDIARLRARTGSQRIIAEVGSPAEAAGLADVAAAEPWFDSVEVHGTIVDLTVTDLNAAQYALPRLMAPLEIGIRRIETPEPTLEEVFVDLVGTTLQ